MENSDRFTIKKSSIEVYYIRPKGNSCGWADISIDEGEKSGRLSISSDYGNWAYYWGACGSSFKEFLISLDISYVSGKFGTGNYFDFEETIRTIKKDIIDSRKNGYSDKEEARELWNSMSDLQNYTHKEGFIAACWNSPIMELYDTGPTIETQYEPGFKRFWETTWQSFISELKMEINKEIKQSA